MKRFSVISHRAVEVFTLRRGRVIWQGLAASCEACGCVIDTGRRTGEGDSALTARLGGNRTKPIAGALACCNCGHEYRVEEEGEAPQWESL